MGDGAVRDATNGETTYGGGRYLFLDFPLDGDLTLDLNQADNPLCAYEKRFSCPMPPVANRLDIEVRAGEKVYRAAK